MALNITKHTDQFSSSPQLNPEEMAEIAKLGFKSIINARPDNEGGNAQPTSAQIQKAAEEAGLSYVHIPVVPNNIQPDAIEACARFVAEAPAPMLGFCKSGMRAASLYGLAEKKNNPNAESHNWLSQKVTHFFANKCLLTKLYRKIANTNK